VGRMCDDCGIPRWQECVCDPRAELGHPDPRNFTLPERPLQSCSTGEGIASEPGSGTSLANGSNDHPHASSPAEWITRLTASLGELAQEHNQGAQAGVDTALDALIGLATRWREERAA
jgi:hypothetical protein